MAFDFFDDLLPKWQETKTKLNNIYVVAYIDHLSKFVAILDKDNKTKEGIYAGTDQKLEIGNVYYFQNTQVNIFPKIWNKRWIMGRLIRCFPSSTSKLDSTWLSSDAGSQTEYTGMYEFHFLNAFDYENELLEKTVLHGFRDVVNDNRYVDKIPLVNEIIHHDNGIISHSQVTLKHYLNEDVNKWDEFKITHETDINPFFSVCKMLKDEHEGPDR